jgi:hypothetical protein
MVNFSARPKTSHLDNILEVYWNGNLVGRYQKSGESQCNWETIYLSISGQSDLGLLEFRDAGTSNSLGTYIDNVYLIARPIR